MFIYSLILHLEFSIVLKINKLGSKKLSNCSKELVSLIGVNFLCGIIGLLPVSFGIDTNMQLKALKINKKSCFLASFLLLVVTNFKFFAII